MEFINNKDLLNNLRNSLINQQQRKTNSDKTNEDKSETVFDAKNINDKKDDNSFYGNAVSLSSSQKKDEPKININDNANAALKSVLNNLLNNMQKPSNTQNTTDNKPNTQNINSATTYSKTANTLNNSKKEVKQDTSQQALQNLLNNIALNNRQKINVQPKPEVKADEKPVSQAEEPVNQTTSTVSETPETTITEPVVQEPYIISVDLKPAQPTRHVKPLEPEVPRLPSIEFPEIPEEKGSYENGTLIIYTEDTDEEGNVYKTWDYTYSSKSNSVSLPTNSSNDGRLSLYAGSSPDDNSSDYFETREITQKYDSQGVLLGTYVTDSKYDNDGFMTYQLATEFDADKNYVNKDEYKVDFPDNDNMRITTTHDPVTQGVEPTQDVETIEMAKTVQAEEPYSPNMDELALLETLSRSFGNINDELIKYARTARSYAKVFSSAIFTAHYTLSTVLQHEDIIYSILTNNFGKASYEYNDNGQIVKAGDYSFEYDNDGNISSIIYKWGPVTEYERDENGKITSIKSSEMGENNDGPWSKEIIVELNDDQKIISCEYKRNYTDDSTIFAFDENYNITRLTKECSDNYKYIYDPKSKKVREYEGNDLWDEYDDSYIDKALYRSDAYEEYVPNTQFIEEFGKKTVNEMTFEELKAEMIEIGTKLDIKGIVSNAEIYKNTESGLHGLRNSVADLRAKIAVMDIASNGTSSSSGTSGAMGIQSTDTDSTNSSNNSTDSKPGTPDGKIGTFVTAQNQGTTPSEPTAEELKAQINEMLDIISEAKYWNEDNIEAFRKSIEDRTYSQLKRKTEYLQNTVLPKVKQLLEISEEDKEHIEKLLQNELGKNSSLDELKTTIFEIMDIWAKVANSEYINSQVMKDFIKKLYSEENFDELYIQYKYYKNGLADCIESVKNCLETINNKIDASEQGSIGDCWLLAGINTFLDKEISHIVKYNEDDKSIDVTFQSCTFTIQGHEIYTGDSGVTIKVEKEEYTSNLMPGMPPNKGWGLSAGDEEVKAIEIAYFRLLEENGIDLSESNNIMIQARNPRLALRLLYPSDKYDINEQDVVYALIMSSRKSLFNQIKANPDAFSPSYIENMFKTKEIKEFIKTLKSRNNYSAVTNPRQIYKDEKDYTMFLENFSLSLKLIGYNEAEVDSAIDTCKNLTTVKGSEMNHVSVNIPTKDGGTYKLALQHAYTVKGYEDGYVQLINPWNNQEVVEIPEIYFLILFDNISYAEPKS